MKFRKTIFVQLIAVMLFLGAQNVMADGVGTDKTSDDVTLNIKLHKIQSLVVNTGQKTVNLEYKEIGDYAGGVTSDQEDHLEVFSTGGFKISAKTSAATLNGVDGNDKKIDVEDVQLLASLGSGNSLSGAAAMSATNLSASDKDIVSSSAGGRALKFDVQYKTIHDADAYINHYRNSENPTVYSTQVTYTIAPN